MNNYKTVIINLCLACLIASSIYYLKQDAISSTISNLSLLVKTFLVLCFGGCFLYSRKKN
ncbi:MAG: hypothetical protein PUD22_09595 [Erysipelotrichaceae bacterium]|nr:hypothetical protein [Erysipelotrichaceae bacterium]